MKTDESTQPFISHLVELRSRILRCMVCIILVFVALLYFANDIYSIVAHPLVHQLPKGSSMIATDITAPFFTPIKLTMVVSLFVSIPYILYQIWGFIAPALYKKEKRLVLPLVVSSTVLFYVGIAFAYFLVFPLAFYFFITTAPADIIINTDITKYLDFVMALFVVFGFAFEVPIAIVLLCWSGITSPQSLTKKRPYIIVAVFAIAMFLTPPDVFSQVLLAVPMCLLFEVGVFFARFYQPKEVDQQNMEENN
ncbi:twin-arginine translocase subunit TatC [Orbaceae bacterium ac157xtp]